MKQKWISRKTTKNYQIEKKRSCDLKTKIKNYLTERKYQFISFKYVVVVAITYNCRYLIASRARITRGHWGKYPIHRPP